MYFTDESWSRKEYRGLRAEFEKFILNRVDLQKKKRKRSSAKIFAKNVSHRVLSLSAKRCLKPNAGRPNLKMCLKFALRNSPKKMTTNLPN